MEISIREAAAALGVSQQRARALVGVGRLRARKVGGRWLVDGASLPSASHRGRPMSTAVAWAFLADSQPDGLSPEAAYRWRQRRSRLANDPEPERLLASWVAARARREIYESRNPDSVLEDPLFVRSGLSDPRAGIAPGGIAEGYVSAGDLRMFRQAHLLRPADSSSNVIVHVGPERPLSPVPLLVLAADLAEHDGPRELARARELILRTVAG